jgi:hypothetical protein
MTALMMACYVIITARQGRYGRATKFGILAGGIIVGSFIVALALGGTSVHDRVMTLFVADPLSVYQSARGTQLTITFRDLLFEHPFGAGLARWGMAASYFGVFTIDTPALWAEIQFTAWMIDGGVLLTVLYCGALIVAAMSQYRAAMMVRSPKLATCASVVMSTNMGVAALIFSFTPFNTQIGLQYWFLAGALHGVASSHGAEGA